MKKQKNRIALEDLEMGLLNEKRDGLETNTPPLNQQN